MPKKAQEEVDKGAAAAKKREERAKRRDPDYLGGAAVAGNLGRGSKLGVDWKAMKVLSRSRGSMILPEAPSLLMILFLLMILDHLIRMKQQQQVQKSLMLKPGRVLKK
jgi:hypothetical protein